MSVFSNQIDLYRKKRHLTLEQLAQAISKGQERDYTKSFVQHVINGTKTNVSLRDVLLFSNALQVPPVLLLIDTMQPLHACHLPTFNGMLNYRAFRRLEEIFGRPSVYCDEYDDAELTVKTVEALEGLYNELKHQDVTKDKLDEENLRLIEQGTPDGEGEVILGKGGNELFLKRLDSIAQVKQSWELFILGRKTLAEYRVDFPEDSSDPFAQSLAYPQFVQKGSEAYKYVSQATSGDCFTEDSNIGPEIERSKRLILTRKAYYNKIMIMNARKNRQVRP